jgi:hypothetical protein
MGAEQIKSILHLRIEQADPRFLRILYAMTEAYLGEHLEEEQGADELIMSMEPSPQWRKLSKEELRAELDEADAEFERGEGIFLEDLDKESEKWQMISVR